MSKVPDRVRPTISTRLGVSLPTAFGALLFAGAVAFGSGMAGAPSPGHSPSKDSTSHADKGGDYRGTGGLVTGQHSQKPQTDKPKTDPPKPPKPEQQQQPETPKPPKPEQQQQPDKPKPQQPKPDKPKPPTTPGAAMQLQATAGIDKVKLTWSKYTGEGFGYYKIVRSTDATVSWPLGAGDTLIGWSHDKWQTSFKDFPTCGTQFFYAVFAVKGGDHGYQLLSASNTVPGTAQCEEEEELPPPPPPPPPPDPTGMALSVANVDGGVQVDWSACGGTGFTAYQVVRSLTNPNPTFPLNAGTELVATITNVNITDVVSINVTTGQTWTFRVVAMGANGSGSFPLCVTPAVSVTVN